jgi:hypothetical protein
VCFDTESASNRTTSQWTGEVKVLTLCRKTVAAYLGPLLYVWLVFVVHNKQPHKLAQLPEDLMTDRCAYMHATQHSQLT